MRDDTARRIVVMMLLGIAWGILADAIGLPWFLWIAGLLVLDLILFRAHRPRAAKHRKPKRVGPPLEWID